MYIRQSIIFEILDSDKLLTCYAMYSQVPPGDGSLSLTELISKNSNYVTLSLL